MPVMHIAEMRTAEMRTAEMRTAEMRTAEGVFQVCRVCGACR